MSRLLMCSALMFSFLAACSQAEPDQLQVIGQSTEPFMKSNMNLKTKRESKSDPIQLQVSPAQSTQQTNTFVFEVKNISDSAVSLQFVSGMSVDLWLMSPQNKRVWSWSQERMFTQVLSQISLAPSEALTKNFQIPAQVQAMITGQGFRWQFKLMASNFPLQLEQTILVTP